MNALAGNLRAVFRLFGVAFTTVWHFLRLVLSPRPKGTTPAEQAELGHKWAQALCRVAGIHIQFGSAERPPPGAVLVSNHRSYADIFVLAACTPVIFLAKAEVARWPFFGRAAKRGGTVFVDRQSRQSGAAAMREMGNRIRAGASLVVFPEGTTQAPPGIGPFRAGGFRLAISQQVPLVPVAIEYERPEDAWTDPEDSSFVRHFLGCFSRPEVRVRVHFGPPLSGDDPEALRAAAEAWISAHLAAPVPDEAVTEPLAA